MKFLVVGIDYFTKWVEAEPLVSTTQQNVKNFVWKNIVCRFGVPKVLVSDNGDNSTIPFSGTSVNTLESKIIIPPLPTLKPTVRLRLQTDPY